MLCTETNETEISTIQSFYLFLICLCFILSCFVLSELVCCKSRACVTSNVGYIRRTLIKYIKIIKNNFYCLYYYLLYLNSFKHKNKHWTVSGENRIRAASKQLILGNCTRFFFLWLSHSRNVKKCKHFVVLNVPNDLTM